MYWTHNYPNYTPAEIFDLDVRDTLFGETPVFWALKLKEEIFEFASATLDCAEYLSLSGGDPVFSYFFPLDDPIGGDLYREKVMEACDVAGSFAVFYNAVSPSVRFFWMGKIFRELEPLISGLTSVHRTTAFDLITRELVKCMEKPEALPIVSAWRRKKEREFGTESVASVVSDRVGHILQFLERPSSRKTISDFVREAGDRPSLEWLIPIRTSSTPRGFNDPDA